MAAVPENGRRLILVGSAANETGGAALAVFDGAAVGSSPAAAPAYRCTGCPAGSAGAYFVFPRSRIQAELGSKRAGTRNPRASEELTQVRVVEARNPRSQQSAGSAYYTFDGAFRLVKAELNRDVELLQRKYETEKLVTSATRFRGDARSSTRSSAGTARATTASTVRRPARRTPWGRATGSRSIGPRCRLVPALVALPRSAPYERSWSCSCTPAGYWLLTRPSEFLEQE